MFAKTHKHQDQPPALSLGGCLPSGLPNSKGKSCQLFIHDGQQPDQSGSFHEIFYQWMGDIESLFGGTKYKIWNSGPSSFLTCRGNQAARSKKQAKMDRNVPKALEHLIAIFPEAQSYSWSPGSRFHRDRPPKPS